MKKIIISGIFVAALTMSVNAQTVDEIINKHIAAMGGKEKMMSLKTVKMTGTNLNPNGVKVDIILTQKYMTGLRTDRSANGIKGYVIVTPKKGWTLNPGETIPKETDDNQLKVAQTRLDIQCTFINYKDKGTKIELTGKEKVNDSECFNLKLTFKNGVITNYYIDSKTYMISKRSNGETFSTYSDYRKNANGYWFAYTTKQGNGAVQTFTKIETNIVVDDKIFQVDEGVF